MAVPLSCIYTNIVQTGQWPDSWKVEHGLPLKKTPNPENEDQIRLISLTPLFSKVFERFVMSWLMEYLKEHLDIGQYGGQKGNSVSHYLVDFINFVSYNQDIKNVHAVLAVAVDFSKAFNRQNHNILIELLSELGVPGWLLQVVMGFLENRQMEVNYKGEKSEKKWLPGFNKRKPIEKIHMKFIDDMTMAESIYLKDKLIKNPNPVHPLQYHERTEHILPKESSKLQQQLNDLKIYTEKHQMKINQDKTKVILFNNATKYDFLPNLTLDTDCALQVVMKYGC